ncbi:MAG: MarR family winged helix-turn-helix transcriptional regulator [Candidatus Limnocylindrales bacterium]
MSKESAASTAEPSLARTPKSPPSTAASRPRAAAEGDRIDAIVADFGRCFGGRTHTHEPPWLARELTFGQIRLLVRLRSTGPQTMGQVADLLGVTVASATGAIERIERHGLVVRAHGTADRRIVECRLTPAGEQVTAEISGVRANAWRRLLGAFDDAELAEFARLVHVLADRTALENGTDPATASAR